MRYTTSWLDETLTRLRRHHGDTASIEVKRAMSGLPQGLGPTVCAFSNMPDGGVIVLGVDEKDNFAITGVSRPAELAAGLASLARDQIDPPAKLADPIELDYDGTTVLVVGVHPLPLEARPAHFHGKPYLRQADGDYAMAPHEIQLLQVSKLLADQRDRPEERAIAGTSLDDLDEDLVAQYLAAFRQARHDRRSQRTREHSDSRILHISGITHADGALSLAGLYALGAYPQGLEPNLIADAAVNPMRGPNGRVVRNKEVFDGPLPDMFAGIMSWCEENLAVVRTYRPDGHMVDAPEIPLAAVRELVGNALVHRDLSPYTLDQGKAIRIRLLPDRLVIQSPGGLRGVTSEQILSSEHAQAPVNPRLYRMTQLLRTAEGTAIIEGEGGGIREVIHACEDAGLDPPVFRDTGVQFTAILFRPTHDTPAPPPPPLPQPARAPQTHRFGQLTRNGTAIAGAFARYEQPTLDEIIAATGLSRAQARHALRILRDAGLVIMSGGRGNPETRYRLAPTDPHQ